LICFIRFTATFTYQFERYLLALLSDFSLNIAFKNIPDLNELLFKLGRTWAEKSGKLDKVRFLIDNDLEIEDLKKEGSLTEKGGRLLKKRRKVILQVLIALWI